MDEYLSFDVEIYNDMEEGNNDLSKLIPSVGAYCTDYENIHYYFDRPFMTKKTSQQLVKNMMLKVKGGYKLFTWNGTSFDLHLLALYSGMIDECARLALDHVDGMFLVVAQKGFHLGLDKALYGAKIESKLRSVELNDKTKLTEMNGSKAPLLWRSGEFSAVMDYLKHDVTQPLKLAYHIQATGYIKWIANSGKLNSLKTNMLTVKECLKLPLPDTAWMKDPKPRENFYDWIPEKILKEEGVI